MARHKRHKGSPVYQVANVKIDTHKRCDKDEAEIISQTLSQYQKHTVKFFKWCQREFGVRDLAKCSVYIQNYADYLKKTGKSPATTHTYLAGVCRLFGVPMGKIKKPPRVNAENIRSRGAKASDERADTKRDASPRLYDLASMVGIRRAEYKRLDGTDLVRDESGYLCVRVKNGKGGKFQLQRILPEHAAAVSTYFDGTTSYLFSRKELKNKIDLHALRAQQARRAYDAYVARIQAEGRDRLIEEIQARWENYAGKQASSKGKANKEKKWDPYLVREKPYFLRGANKKLAIDSGLPVEYNRLALMAVSVFHLSHWRLGVTVSNYMLAVN